MLVVVLFKMSNWKVVESVKARGMRKLRRKKARPKNDAKLPLLDASTLLSRKLFSDQTERLVFVDGSLWWPQSLRR